MRQFLTFFLLVFLILVNIMLAKRTAIVTAKLEKQSTELQLCQAKCE